eukprot:g78733.t1
MTALLHAAKQGNTALGKVLVEGKADVNVKSKASTPSHHELVDSGLEMGTWPRQSLCSLPSCVLCVYPPPPPPSKEHMTALLHAAKQGNTALGKVLVEGKADVNVKSKEQLTALLLAAKQDNAALGKILVEGKAGLNVMDQATVAPS